MGEAGRLGRDGHFPCLVGIEVDQRSDNSRRRGIFRELAHLCGKQIGDLFFAETKLVGSMPSGGWIYEIKFDGYRALAWHGGSETRVLSRNQKDLGVKFPEVKTQLRHSMFRTQSLIMPLTA
jgi:ATP dependent DNA ligase domain